MAQSPRLYLVGAGTMARQHAQASAALARDVDLHAADPSPQARETFAALFPNATLHEDAEAMLASSSEETDLVVIATPPWLHRSYIETASRSGRHVLCEKPLLMNKEDIEAVAETLRETGRLLGCCSVRFLANPANRRVAELVECGELGDIYSVRWLQGSHRLRSGIEWQPESPFFLDKSRNGGGVVMDWAAYDLCILQDILHPHTIRVLHATMTQPELPAEPAPTTVFDVETHAVATLLYECPEGSPIPVHFERQSGSFDRDLSESTINGTRGSVSWSCMGWEGDIELCLRNAEEEQGKAQILAPPAEGWFDRAPLGAMLDLIEGRPHHALVGADALFQAAVLRAIYEAAETGREVVVERDAFADVPARSGMT
ncbi:MAG: Gfo/Idh/MocA family oxidoreductase [bacterium]|nr:hypothetical protein [Deltaproteobacteria bacterium]MCP4908114.1 Gfo/Idh/MocA family oxidoreductase [bacterium]